MLEEIEIRIQVAESQIKQDKRELRKLEDSIKMHEGEILALKTILELAQSKGATIMSEQQLREVDALNKYYQINDINRRVDYIRFAILNDRERDEVIKTEKALCQRIEDERKKILDN